jgi:hypothetical protein
MPSTVIRHIVGAECNDCCAALIGDASSVIVRPLGRDIMSQEPWGVSGWQGPYLRLRGWLARYVWPSYDQARFIEAAKRDIKKLVEGEPELR